MPKDDRIITDYARMWPREILYLSENLLKDVRSALDRPGVYVLYRDEHPYYVGRADRLYRRLNQHANNPRARRFHFWNFFSAYVIPNRKHIGDVEGVLIT